MSRASSVLCHKSVMGICNLDVDKSRECRVEESRGEESRVDEKSR